MKASFWLAWRELVTRKSAFMTGLCMVSVGIALCTATELLSMQREAAVAAQIDHMGPPLRLIPAGKTAYDLARFDLGSDSFGINDSERIYRALAPWVRALEGRLLLRVPLEGRMTPAIGIDPGAVISPFEVLDQLGPEDVALGTDLAQRLGQEAGDELFIKEKRFRIAAILPAMATAEDLAIFLPLRGLRSLLDLPETVNEIRIFPTSGTSIETIVAEIRSNHPKISVINMHRGDTAEHEIGHTLLQHRSVLYMITALAIALCIFIWSYLNAEERKFEVATVVAIGGTGITVLSMLVFRAAAVGFLGALLGYLAGASIALVQDLEWAFGLIVSWKLLLVMSGGAVLLSVFGASAASLPSLFRRHASVLQEW
jgi:ABC-type lipoprotein release transport system permease subunit